MIERIQKEAGKRKAITVTFYLKPYLHDYVRHVIGQDVFVIDSYTIIGNFALCSMTPKPNKSDRRSADFSNGRKPFVGIINLNSSVRGGFNIYRPGHFEKLVEHLFYFEMFNYVEWSMEQGFTQNHAIKEFLEQHDVDLEGIEMDAFRRTISRRRNNAWVGKKFGPNCPRPETSTAATMETNSRAVGSR